MHMYVCMYVCTYVCASECHCGIHLVDDVVLEVLVFFTSSINGIIRTYEIDIITWLNLNHVVITARFKPVKTHESRYTQISLSCWTYSIIGTLLSINHFLLFSYTLDCVICILDI
jgi:hypothetical protein